jgi:hypothetical protein
MTITAIKQVDLAIVLRKTSYELPHTALLAGIAVNSFNVIFSQDRPAVFNVLPPETFMTLCDKDNYLDIKIVSGGAGGVTSGYGIGHIWNPEQELGYPIPVTNGFSQDLTGLTGAVTTTFVTGASTSLDFDQSITPSSNSASPLMMDENAFWRNTFFTPSDVSADVYVASYLTDAVTAPEPARAFTWHNSNPGDTMKLIAASVDYSVDLLRYRNLMWDTTAKVLHLYSWTPQPVTGGALFTQDIVALSDATDQALLQSALETTSSILGFSVTYGAYGFVFSCFDTVAGLWHFFQVNKTYTAYRRITYSAGDAVATQALANANVIGNPLGSPLSLSMGMTPDADILVTGAGGDGSGGDPYRQVMLYGDGSAIPPGGWLPGPYFPFTPTIGNYKVRAFTFTLDGHDFYALRLGETETLVYDTLSQKWAEWNSADLAYWRANSGISWIGAQNLANTYGSDIVVGDNNLGLLWFLDPLQQQDNNTEADGDPVSFNRRVTGQIALTGHQTINCYAAYLSASVGTPAYIGASVTLSTSDDFGHNYVNQGAVAINALEYNQEIVWRSIGQIASPGRLFLIEDDGAIARIDSLEMNDDAG